MINLDEVFKKFDDEYMEFYRVENKLHNRPDICAFLLLDKLVPGDSDIITASEHDEFFLDTDIEKLADIATEADILTLVRCGVRYSDEGLCMFA